jgi:hypothetical protein
MKGKANAIRSPCISFPVRGSVRPFIIKGKLTEDRQKITSERGKSKYERATLSHGKKQRPIEYCRAKLVGKYAPTLAPPPLDNAPLN